MTGAPDNLSPPRRSLAMSGDFLRRLESLGIAAAKLSATGGIATRAGTVRGGRVEFLEHKGYVEGDDLRDLDWNVYARTGEPFVKVFGAEREKHVTLIVDLSASMAAVPEKDVFACRLATALAHVALAAGDTVRLGFARDDLSLLPPKRGVHATRDLIARLEREEAAGAVDWNHCAASYLAATRTPGACIVIGDFWLEGIVRRLAPLAAHRQEVTLLQTLTRDELSPSMTGSVRLADSETGEEVSLSLSGRDLDAYRAAVENHLDAIRDGCRRHGMRHILCRADMPFEHVVLTLLRQGGLLK